MYKLFLCLRYLKSKLIAWMAILGVGLCVWMMLIAVSVMTSFLDRIEEAAKGLFGDIIMEPVGTRGIAWYDEFIDEVEEDPSVEAATPFLLTVGMLRLGDQFNDYRQPVQVAGIRLPGRAAATDFEEGLFVQENDGAASFDPRPDRIETAVAEHRREMAAIAAEAFPAQFAALAPDLRRTCGESIEILIYPDPQQHGLTVPQVKTIMRTFDPSNMTPDKRNLWHRLKSAWQFQEIGLRNLRSSPEINARLADLRKKIAAMEKAGESEIAIDEYREQLEALELRLTVQPPAYRVIPGLGIPGLSFRTDTGEVVRLLTPGNEIILYVAPLGRELSVKQIEPSIHSFTVIDDNCSGVSSIDDKMVYIPLETAQKMNHMDAAYDTEGKLVEPARCSQIHIKAADAAAGEMDLRAIAAKIRGYWEVFHRRHPGAALTDMSIQTWRQRQSKVVAPIESQRVMVIIMIGIISVVAIALIFVILYTIVVQKTREIGIIKAVGASSAGVASLFFLYGIVISIIGSALGILGGWLVVRDINTIHDWVGEEFGLRVFSRDTHMFSTIPNQVDWTAALVIVIGAVAAGLLGALIPALRAARMQPVEALRYE